MNFLDSNGVSYRSGTAGEALDPTELAEVGKSISAFILCL
jgi:hypothetical protein